MIFTTPSVGSEKSLDVQGFFLWLLEEFVKKFLFLPPKKTIKNGGRRIDSGGAASKACEMLAVSAMKREELYALPAALAFCLPKQGCA